MLARHVNDLTAADRELEPALRSARTEPRARLLRSQWLLASRDLDGALEHAQRAAALVPRWSDAHHALAVVRLARNEIDEAVRSFKSVRDLTDGEDPRVDAQIAHLELARGKATEALEFAASAAAASPEPEYAALVARAARAAGDVTRARQTVADALLRWPGNPALETERGFMELAAGRPRSARTAFERALRGQPQPAETRYGLVASQVAGKRPQDARAAIARWQQHSPDDVQIAILSARLDLEEGNAGAAEQTLQRVLDRKPNDADALEALAHLYLTTRRGDKAVEAYERLVALRPRSASALIVLGVLRHQLGDANAARMAYERALDVDARAGIAANNLAWLQIEAGELEAAVQSARVAERALDSAPEALDTLGWAYHLTGRHDDAIRALTAARDKAPAKAIYRYRLGVALAAVARHTESRAELKEALRLSPSFDGADDARQRLDGKW
jgi:tetratricopeptide (TPR) repeat protein